MSSFSAPSHFRWPGYFWACSTVCSLGCKCAGNVLDVYVDIFLIHFCSVSSTLGHDGAGELHVVLFPESLHVTRAFKNAFLIAPVFSLRNMRRKHRLVIGNHKGGFFSFAFCECVCVISLCLCMREWKTVGACGLKKTHKPYIDVVPLL